MRAPVHGDKEKPELTRQYNEGCETDSTSASHKKNSDPPTDGVSPQSAADLCL